jgi:hypothetical protein
VASHISLIAALQYENGAWLLFCREGTCAGSGNYGDLVSGRLGAECWVVTHL